MGFHFNPSLWFICKLCRETFPDTEKLKAHKLESHLRESLNIKCIVFEEKLLDHEWIPPSPAYLSKHDQLLNLGCALTPEIIDGDSTDISNPLTEFVGQNQIQIKFTNPYVSLKRVTVQELNCATSASASMIGFAGTRSKVGKYCNNFESTDTNGNTLSNQKQSFASEVSSFPSKLHIKTDDDDPDYVHKNKIRDLLSNAVIIKSEPNNDTDDQVFLKPQDLPISIVSAYSLSPSSYNANIPTDPLNTPVPVLAPVPGTASVKMEFIDSDFIANQNVAILSSMEQPQQLLQFDVKPDVLGFLESASNNSGESAQVAQAQNTLRCQICNIFFKNKYCLAQHKLRPCTDRTIKCPHCDLKFITRSVLRAHLIARHGQTSPCKCQYCGKYFSTRSKLLEHEAAHTGYRPFKCHFQGCAASFASQSYLHCHRRCVHGKDLGLPQFACSICEKSYGLIKHLNTHTRKAHKT